MGRIENIGLTGREIWFDGRQVAEDRQDIWGIINNSPITNIIVNHSQRESVHFPMKTRIITWVNSNSSLESLNPGDIVISDDSEVLEKASQYSLKTCIFIDVAGRDALERTWKEASRYDYVVVDFDLPTNIPLELLIARLQKSSTILLKMVKNFSEMEVVFGVMEQGSDGVVLSTTDINELAKAGACLPGGAVGKIELQPMTVTGISHIGMGMRACIDTTGLMSQDEGMLVGSTSGGGIFVCSETHYLPYMNLRPFRVNAGAIHSYVWMPGDAAEYITDLAAGSKVLCVNTNGDTRILTVGRVKTETRPLLLIKGTASGCEINVVVQDDWHIRVMGSDGKPRNATEVRAGDMLLAYICKPGRHVGIKVDETILER